MDEIDPFDTVASWVSEVEECLDFDFLGFEVRGEGRARGVAKEEVKALV